MRVQKRALGRLFFAWVALLLGPITAALILASCGEGGEGSLGTAGSGIVATLEMDAAYPEPFSFLSGVRELPDGTLLAADPLSQVLLKVDMEAGTADTLGGVGGGPQEYEQPDQVFALPGDSTLLVDLGKMYMTVVGPDGAFHDGMSMALTSEDGRPSFILPRAVDSEGRIYAESSGVMGGGPQDSTAISRYDRSTGSSERVAMVWRTPPTITRSGDNVSMSLRRMVPNDDWAVTPEGRVAVIRANGYFVEWHSPDGEVVRGPETPYEVLPISYSDKEADLAESTTAGLGVAITMDSEGGSSMQMRRGGFGMDSEERAVEDQEWGETFPPFRQRRSVASPANDVWVQRWLPADQPPMMDVFGPDGVLKGSVMVPVDRRLIGFGEGPAGENLAYFVRTDEVDLQWLERYRIRWN
jgi:hypothetical protein